MYIMKNLLKILIIILVLLFVPIIALADTLYLNDGSTIEGKIINVTDHNVTIENDLGTLIINKENIQKIEFSESPEEKTEEDELREKIKEKLKGLFDDEDIVIIIITADELTEEEDSEEEVENEEVINEDEAENEEVVNEDEENEELVEVHNEYDGEEEVDNSNDEEANNNINDDDDNDEWNETNFHWKEGKKKKFNKESMFSIGITTIATMDLDIWEMEESNNLFGLSFRYAKSWFGVNLDANIGFDLLMDPIVMYALGVSLRVPKKVSLFFSLGATYKHYIDDFVSADVGAYIGNGVEFFFSNVVSMQIYTNVHFTFIENMNVYGDSDYYYDSIGIPEFIMGIALYFNI